MISIPLSVKDPYKARKRPTNLEEKNVEKELGKDIPKTSKLRVSKARTADEERSE